METMLLRIFQGQVLLQCRFVLLASHEVNSALLTGDTTRCFYALQNLLNAAASISKTLWGQRGEREEERKPIRESIGISNDSPLKPIGIRNDFEHFDERLEKWWKKSKHHNYFDLNLSSRTGIVGVSEVDWFRNFDPQTGEVMFWGTDFNLNLLVKEIMVILPKLTAEVRKPSWEMPPKL